MEEVRRAWSGRKARGGGKEGAQLAQHKLAWAAWLPSKQSCWFAEQRKRREKWVRQTRKEEGEDRKRWGEWLHHATHTWSSVSLGDTGRAGSRHDRATVGSPLRYISTELSPLSCGTIQTCWAREEQRVRTWSAGRRLKSWQRPRKRRRRKRQSRVWRKSGGVGSLRMHGASWRSCWACSSSQATLLNSHTHYFQRRTVCGAPSGGWRSTQPEWLLSAHTALRSWPALTLKVN